MQQDAITLFQNIEQHVSHVNHSEKSVKQIHTIKIVLFRVKTSRMVNDYLLSNLFLHVIAFQEATTLKLTQLNSYINVMYIICNKNCDC